MKVHKEPATNDLDDAYCQTYDAEWMTASIAPWRVVYSPTHNWWEVTLMVAMDYLYDLSVFNGSQMRDTHWRDVTDEELEILIHSIDATLRALDELDWMPE